jgi:hypothetical protein
MENANYQLTEEQKKELAFFSQKIVGEIESELSDEAGTILDPYDIPGEIFNSDKFNAMVRYIGNRLSCY